MSLSSVPSNGDEKRHRGGWRSAHSLGHEELISEAREIQRAHALLAQAIAGELRLTVYRRKGNTGERPS